MLFLIKLKFLSCSFGSYPDVHCYQKVRQQMVLEEAVVENQEESLYYSTHDSPVNSMRQRIYTLTTTNM